MKVSSLAGALVLLSSVSHAADISKLLQAAAVERVDALAAPALAPENKEWECSVGAWVRAPDLSPNVFIQGDARLRMNGSSCWEVNKWELGLRLKERAIVRLRAEGVEFPVKPVWNKTLHGGGSNLKDGIYDAGRHFTQNQNEFSKAMSNYSQQLMNKDLWEVHGAERSVFDITTVLRRTTDSGAFPTADVQSFSLHVPNTNFPPTKARSFSYQRNELDFTSSETMFEYYFKLSLNNGSILDYPAGHTAFIPSGVENVNIALSADSVVELENPNRRKRVAPEGRLDEKCDNGGEARFSVKLNNAPNQFIQGDVVPLNLTIIRSGNGTEYPFRISLSHLSTAHPSWAFTKAHSDDQRTGLAATRVREGFMFNDRGGQMLKAKTHHKRPEQFAKANRVVHMTSSVMFGEERGMNLTQVDEQHIIYNFNITNASLPSFNKTFIDFVSLLKFNLHTRYYCEPSTISPETSLSVLPSNSLDKKKKFDIESDDNWLERSPSARSIKIDDSSSSALVSAMQFSHLGNITITVLMPPTPDSLRDPPTHYTSTSALAPTFGAANAWLKDSQQSAVAFGLVNTTWELQDESTELKSGEYNTEKRVPGGMKWVNGRATTGARQHVGEVWEEKLLRERLEMEEALSDVESTLIVQA